MNIKKKSFKYIVFDIVFIVISAYLGLMLRFDGYIPYRFFDNFKLAIIPIVLLKILFYNIFGLYKIYWEKAGINEALTIGLAIFSSSLVIMVYMYFNRLFPLSSVAISSVIELLLIGLFRYTMRSKSDHHNVVKKQIETTKRSLIVGAGEAGVMVSGELLKHPEVGTPVAYVDDDKAKLDSIIKGIRVVGTTQDIEEVVKDYKIDEIILAIPSASPQTRRRILKICTSTNKKVKVVPGIYELLDGKVDFRQIRDVQIEDLLGRKAVHLDNPSLRKMIESRTILVTGGGGSIGSELCRQIAKYQPKKLVILDIYENNAYDIQMELRRTHPELNLEVAIESIRDRDRMDVIFNHYRPDIVFHAAAHKHVPLMEDSFNSAVKNNIFGTKNLLELADKYHVDRFVNISTDKAVNPTNIMGCTKRVIEIMLQTIDKKSKTDYVAVRFGNVLGSNGSVIPLFKKQIKNGGPVTVTHPDIIRYFMTIPEACQLVLQAGAIAKGGEIFILDMGEPVKILDLAENLIRLSGFIPYEEIDIVFTGLRPGEKLYEELLLDLDNSEKTDFEKIYIEKAEEHDEEKLDRDLDKLWKLCLEDGSKEEFIAVLSDLVPTFNHKEN